MRTNPCKRTRNLLAPSRFGQLRQPSQIVQAWQQSLRNRLAWWGASATIVGMTDTSTPVVGDLLDRAGRPAQRPAINVIEYPAGNRDEVMQRIGNLLTEAVLEAGCTPEMAHEFGVTIKQAIRDCFVEIKVSGGGTVGTV
jgi:hypothetical protein